MKLIPNLLALVAFGLLTTYSQVKDLGTIYKKNWIAWDYDFTAEPNVRDFRVWIARTNDLLPGVIYTNKPAGPPFVSLGEVKEKGWPGASGDSGLNGSYAVAVTAIASFPVTNIVGTNVTVKLEFVESDVGEVGIATFKDGVPIPPSNYQLMQVLQYMATNSIPSLPGPEPAPPMPAAMSRNLKAEKDLYQPSGR